MSRRSNIERLPPIVKDFLDRALDAPDYQGLEHVAKDFASRGWKISKSALHRYAQRRTEFKQAARFEAEVLSNIGESAAFLVHWARANPKEARRLVRRLQKKQQEGVNRGERRTAAL